MVTHRAGDRPTTTKGQTVVVSFDLRFSLSDVLRGFEKVQEGVHLSLFIVQGILHFLTLKPTAPSRNVHLYKSGKYDGVVGFHSRTVTIHTDTGYMIYTGYRMICTSFSGY